DSQHAARIRSGRLHDLLRQGKDPRLLRHQQKSKTGFTAKPTRPAQFHEFATPSKNSPRRPERRAEIQHATMGEQRPSVCRSPQLLFGLADATSAPSRFLGEGPTTTSIPSGGKIRPVYGVCQEQNTIYCTISYDALLFRLSCSFLVF